LRKQKDELMEINEPETHVFGNENKLKIRIIDTGSGISDS
jgi:hypothetical protein